MSKIIDTECPTRFLVTGASGFIGKNLISALKKKQQEVYGISRNALKTSDYSHLQCDLRDSDALKTVFELCRPNYVIHLACSSIPKTSNDSPAQDIKDNLASSVELLELCVKYNVQKIIFASSGGAIYGHSSSNLLTEEHSTRPINAYGINKLAFEKYLSLFHDLHGLKYCSLRISNPYGPHQNAENGQGVIAAFISAARNNKNIQIWGDGSIIRDYIYIDDVIEAIILSVGNDVNGVFNISTGAGYSINEILAQILELTSSRPTVEYKPKRNCDTNLAVLSPLLAKDTFNWEAKVNLTQGIATTIAWNQNEERI